MVSNANAVLHVGNKPTRVCTKDFPKRKCLNRFLLLSGVRVSARVRVLESLGVRVRVFELSARSTMRTSVITVLSVLLFLIVIAFCSFGFSLQLFPDGPMKWKRSVVANRRLLHEEVFTGKRTEPNRIGSVCSKDDIVVYQGATAPLPSGIPTYTVQILNECVEGCSIGRIHLHCGWFSSARLVNPRIFKRLQYDDCLVNDGRPLANGASLSFEYANSFRYPLSVSAATCLD